MSTVTVPEAPNRPPIRIGWGVLALRVLATASIILGALLVTRVVSYFHSWNMGEATIICPEPHEVYPNSEVAEIRAFSSWGNGSSCTYLASNGRKVGETLGPAGFGERNVFEPRFSFVATAVVIAGTWLVGLALVRFVWMVGRVVRRPRPLPLVPLS